MDLGTLTGFLELDAGPFEKGLDKAHDKLGDFGGKASKVAGGIGLGVGLAMAGSLVKAMDLQPAKAKLSAQLGFAPKDSARIGKLAGQVFASNYGGSLDEVNDAIKSVQNNIGDLRKMSDADITSISEQAISLGQTFDQDVGGVTKAVGQLIKTGLVKDAQAGLDLVAKGFQGPANKADDLLDTFNEYGVQFQKLGLDGPAALGLLNQAVKGGARDSDLAADALKEFSIRAVDGSKSSAAGYKALGLNAADMTKQIAKGGPAAKAGLGTVLERLKAIKDPVKQAAAATALFGTQAEDLGGALYKFDTKHATGELGKVAGAAKAVDKTVGQTASGNIESFKRQVSTAFVDYIGGKALPAVTKLTGELASNFGPALSAVAGWLGRNKDIVLPLAVGLGTLVGGVLLIVGAMRAWAVVQGILNVVMSANPIGLIVIAIAALVAGLIYAYRHSAKFREIVQGAMSGAAAAFRWVIAAAGAVWDWLKSHWTLIAAVVAGPLLIAVGLIRKHWSAIRGFFTAAWNFISTVFSVSWASLKAIVTHPLETAKTMVTTLLGKAGLLKPFTDASLWVLKTWSAVWGGIKEVFTHPIKSAKDAIATLLGKSGLRKVFSDAVSDIGTAWSKLEALAKKPISFIINTVLNAGLIGAFNWLADKLPGIGHIDPISLPGFEHGGYTGAGGRKQVAGITHAGEVVWDQDAVDGAGGWQNVEAWRMAAKAGRLSRPGDVGLPGYDAGGFVQALSYARANAGHPYQFGTYWDCSGFMSALQNIIYGKNPYSGRWVTPAFAGGPQHAQGFTRNLPSAFMIGVDPRSGKFGHTAGTLLGTNVEEAGGVGARVGPSARGYNDGYFPLRYGLDKGAGMNVGGGGIVEFVKSLTSRLSKPLDQLGSIEDSTIGRIAAAVPRSLEKAMVGKVKDALGFAGGTGLGGAPSGFAWTSEKGAELVVNPQLRRYSGGEGVFTADETADMLGGKGRGVTQINNFAHLDPQTGMALAMSGLEHSLSAKVRGR